MGKINQESNNSNDHRHEHLIDEQDYPPLRGKKFRLIFVSFFIFLTTFILTFPLTRIVSSQLDQILSQVLGCPVTYQNTTSTYLPPGFEIIDLSIPNACLSDNQKEFKVSKVGISFGGLNFSPLGLVLNVHTDIFKNQISLKVIPGARKQFLKLNKQKLNLTKFTAELANSFGTTLLLQGNVELNTDILVSNNSFDIGKLFIKSSDFILPSQNISGFVVDDMNLQKIDIELKGKKSNLLLEKLTLGTANAPVMVNGSGSININPADFMTSLLNIELDLTFSQQFIDKLGFIKFALAQFKKNETSYTLLLKGTIGAPKPTPK